MAQLVTVPECTPLWRGEDSKAWTSWHTPSHPACEPLGWPWLYLCPSRHSFYWLRRPQRGLKGTRASSSDPSPLDNRKGERTQWTSWWLAPWGRLWSSIQYQPPQSEQEPLTDCWHFQLPETQGSDLVPHRRKLGNWLDPWSKASFLQALYDEKLGCFAAKWLWPGKVHQSLRYVWQLYWPRLNVHHRCN